MHKKLRWVATFAAVAMLIFGLSACAGASQNNVATNNEANTATEPQSSSQATETQPAGDLGKALVVYYSATGNTADVAGYIAASANADTFELTPVNPYSTEDLNWNDTSSRVYREHDDPSLRDVELTDINVPDWDSYDTVFLGYPIWWGIAAWPVDGFVSGNDFTGKTVIPFCTSSSSGIGESAELLYQLTNTGDWQTGHRFSSSATQQDVDEWVATLQ